MECAAFFVAHFSYNQNLGSTDKRWGPQFISPKNRKGKAGSCDPAFLVLKFSRVYSDLMSPELSGIR